MAKSKVEVVVKNAKTSPVKEKSPKAPAGCIIAKAGKYEVLRKCYQGIRLYDKGSIYEAEDGEILSAKTFRRAKRLVEVDD